MYLAGPHDRPPVMYWTISWDYEWIYSEGKWKVVCFNSYYCKINKTKLKSLQLFVECKKKNWMWAYVMWLTHFWAAP